MHHEALCTAHVLCVCACVGGGAGTSTRLIFVISNEMSQQLLDGLALNLVQIFMVPKGGYHHHKVKHRFCTVL